MANYAVYFDNTGYVSIPTWTATADWTIEIEFKSGPSSVTDGLAGNTGSDDWIAVYSDGHYTFRAGGVSEYSSAVGIIATNTDYKMTFTCASGTVTYSLKEGAAETVVDSGTFSHTGSFDFTRLGSCNNTVHFEGQIRRVILSKTGDDRDYYSSVNTGSNWTDIGNSQDGTLTGLPTDGSQWVLIPADTTVNAISASIDVSTFFATVTLGNDTNVSATLASIDVTAYQATVTTSSPTNISATLASIDVSTNAATVTQVYGIVTEPLKNNTGTVLASTGSIIANVYNLSTGALVVRKTGLTSDANGVIQFTDASLSASTTYLVLITVGSSDGVARIATGA